MIMLLTLFLFGYYVIHSMSGYLYRDEKVNVTTMANMISIFAGQYITPDNTAVDEGFGAFLQTLKLDTKERVILLNKDSIALFDSEQNQNVLGKAQVKQTVITALSGKEGYQEYQNDDEHVMVLDAAVPIMAGGQVIGAVNIVYSSNKISDFLAAVVQDVLLLVVVISFLVGLIIFVVANFMTRRVVEFTKKINEMSDGILDEKLEVKGHDEIAQLGEAFNEMREKLSEVEEKRSQFVSNASHELKTPLSSIKLMADSIIQTPDISMEQVREFLGDITSEVDRLNRIVNRLLYITRMDSVTESREFELTNLRNLVLDIVRNLRPLAERDHIALQVDAPQDVYMMMDADRLWQGIYNLCDNAIKYTREYGQVDVILKKENTAAVVTVRDNGVGLTPEERERIFDRFYRVDKARARDTGGTGLGLSIVQSVVALHGGEIQVQSEPNMGSEFKIILPLAE